MKYLYIALFLFVLTGGVFSQKLITSINSSNRVEPYSFKYDHPTGAFIYSDYDTAAKKNVLFTGKGKSKEYDFAVHYISLFDEKGNVYSYAYNYLSDTASVYFLLKNNEEIASFDFIGDGWDIKNGLLYFLAKENDRSFIASYNLQSGVISYGKKYDEIYLVSYPDYYYEGEPSGSIGFTGSGEPFYVASEGGEKFLVIGDREQKHYSDIDYYMFKTDLNGDPVYIARDKGLFYAEKGNTFIVQGSREYNKFDYIYGPILFGKDNIPVYVASDSTGEYKYRSRIMAGNKAGKSYDGSIYDFKITPSGEIAYIVSGSDTDPNTGESVYTGTLVIGSREIKKYSSIINLKFDGGETPVYTAMDKNNKYFVVKGKKIISEKYDNVYDFSFLDDGSLAYAGTNYGNYDKHIPDRNFIHIGGKKFGPFDYVSMADYNTGNYVLSAGGMFAFITGRMSNEELYAYKYKVTSSAGEGAEYDLIDQLKIAGGKVIYVSGSLYDNENYLYKYNLYIDNKPAAENYDSITELNVDTKTGKVTFIGCKDNSFYLVEIGI